VTSWISNFTKKLDGDGEPDEYDRSAEQRRSADHNRYDADNRVLGDDFAQLEMRDNEGVYLKLLPGQLDVPLLTRTRATRAYIKSTQCQS
jgi:hypothetical protein